MPQFLRVLLEGFVTLTLIYVLVMLVSKLTPHEPDLALTTAAAAMFTAIGAGYKK